MPPRRRKRKGSSLQKAPLVFTESPIHRVHGLASPLHPCDHPATADVVPVDLGNSVWVSPQFRSNHPTPARQTRRTTRGRSTVKNEDDASVHARTTGAVPETRNTRRYARIQMLGEANVEEDSPRRSRLGEDSPKTTPAMSRRSGGEAGVVSEQEEEDLDVSNLRSETRSATGRRTSKRRQSCLENSLGASNGRCVEDSGRRKSRSKEEKSGESPSVEGAETPYLINNRKRRTGQSVDGTSSPTVMTGQEGDLNDNDHRRSPGDQFTQLRPRGARAKKRTVLKFGETDGESVQESHEEGGTGPFNVSNCDSPQSPHSVGFDSILTPVLKEKSTNSIEFAGEAKRRRPSRVGKKRSLFSDVLNSTLSNDGRQLTGENKRQVLVYDTPEAEYGKSLRWRQLHRRGQTQHPCN